MNIHFIKLKLILSIFLINNLYHANGFCYNTYNKIVFIPEQKYSNQSYFGYTTLLRDGENPTLIVGAPRDNSKYLGQISIKNPGAIYKCLVNLKKSENRCQQQPLDTSASLGSTISSIKSYINKKDNMWLGMSIAGTTNNNGTIAICAPRWINQYQDHKINGLCYTSQNTLTQNMENLQQLRPLVDRNKQFIELDNPEKRAQFGSHGYYYAHGQAGFSSQISDDNSELLLGAPGIYIWTGSIIRYKLKNGSLGNDPDSEYVKEIANPSFTQELIDNIYLGYSVGFGKFISNRNQIYVAGAPRGAGYKGEVYIFSFPKRKNSRIDIKAQLEGKNVGEYFGSTIATIDIDQDGLTDLIVGAPLYAETTGWDIGRVYVYMNKDRGEFIEQTDPIYGSYRDGARFGTSIADIGDINGDGIIDVAIGAPYEDYNNGAVYIYLGTKYGLNPVYVQRITFDNMKGFGISISKGVDIDKNSCKDIAIGAYESESVVLLRCHPSVGVVHRIETIPAELSMNDTEMTAQICIKFQGSERFKTDLDVSLFIDIEYERVTFHDMNDSMFRLTGKGGEESCKDILVKIQENIDYSKSIEIKMTYKLNQDPMTDDTFCPHCTVLRPTESREFFLRVPFITGCGDDLICRPDLKIDIEPLTNISPYIIGSTRSIQLNISLENTGETSFMTQIQISASDKTPLIGFPSNCRLEFETLYCDFDKPFTRNAQGFNFTIEYSTLLLLNTDEELTFNVTATSSGKELTPEDNISILNVKLKLLTITSKVEPMQFNYLHVNGTEVTQNISIMHSYEIFNMGPSPVDMFTLNFYLPISYLDTDKNTTYNIMNVYETKATIDNQTMICNILSESYLKRKTESHMVDSSDDESCTKVNYTKMEDNYKISKLDQNVIDEYISYLPSTNDLNVLISTLHINCTDKKRVSCLIFECTGRLPKIGSNGAQIQFQIDVNHTSINTLLKNEYFISLASYVMADSKYIPRRMFGWARSYMIGTAPSAEVSIWLIILAIFIGILLLTILICVLYKKGFFKRQTKEKMELLKNEDMKGESPPIELTVE